MTDSVPCRRCGTRQPARHLVLRELRSAAGGGRRGHHGPARRVASESARARAAVPCNRTGSAFCSECGFNIRSATGSSPAEPVAESHDRRSSDGRAPRPGRPAPAAVAMPGWGLLVLAIAAAGLITAWFLPFSLAPDSLADQALGTRRLRDRVLERLPGRCRTPRVGLLRGRCAAAGPVSAHGPARRRRHRLGRSRADPAAWGWAWSSRGASPLPPCSWWSRSARAWATT